MYSSRTEGAALIQDAVYTRTAENLDILKKKFIVVILIYLIFNLSETLLVPV